MSTGMDPISVRMGLENIIATDTKLFKGSDRILYASMQSNNGLETVPINGERFEAWLKQQSMDSGLPVSKPAIELAIEAATAKPWPDDEVVSVRVGSPSPDDVIYWDYADGTGRAIKITAEGSETVEEPGVLFPTHESRGPLREPVKGGNVHGLRDKFSLSARNEAVIFSFLVSCLRGAGPYPILAIVGPDGCGKSALAKCLRAIIDPVTLKLRNLPRNYKELAITARDNHLLAYDDIGEVPAWFGSAICKLSKGTNFTDTHKGNEQVLFEGARPVMLVGGEDILLNWELASRALVVRLEARTTFISGMVEDLRGIDQVRGALLDIVAHGLGRLHAADVRAPVYDYEFERWITACELSRWGLEVDQKAYQAGVAERVTDLVELNPLLMTLRDYMRDVQTYRGTMARLLENLEAALMVAKGSRWPKSPRGLSGQLRRDAKLLPEIDMEFDITEGHNHNRIVVLTLKSSPTQSPEANGEASDPGLEDKPKSPAKARAKKSAPAKQSELFEGLS